MRLTGTAIFVSRSATTSQPDGPRTARTWRWLLAPVRSRPRRITVLAWWLIFLFSNGIDHLLARYSKPLLRIDDWLLVILAVPLPFLVAGAWIRGRKARRAKRERARGSAS